MRSWWLTVTLCLYVPLAVAQFKWVDDAGRIGYGDKPPPRAHDIEALDGYVKGSHLDPMSELPYQLRRTVQDFPVTLYTMTKCPACDRGRALLRERAVPYAERTIGNVDDAQALKKISGSDQLPVFQVGKGVMTGFSSAGWNDALDLAGYPRERQLPAHWSWPAPRPLAEPKPAQAAATDATAPDGGKAP